MAVKYTIGLLLTLFMSGLDPTPGIAKPILTREMHVLKSEEGDTRIILRLPMILAYITELSRLAPGQPLVAPFINHTPSEIPPVARLDRQAVYDDYSGFAEFLLRDFRFSVNGNQIIPEMPEYVVIDTSQPDGVNMNIGSGLMGSSSMLEICVSDFPDQSDIADTLIVMSFFLADVMPLDTLKIELLSETVAAPEGITFQTEITDYRTGAAQTLHFSGPGFEPVTLSGGAPVGLARSASLAMAHVMSGYGWMLLLLCLVLGAAGLGYHGYRRRRPSLPD